VGLLLVLLGAAVVVSPASGSSQPVTVSAGPGEASGRNPGEAATGDRVELVRRSWTSIVGWLETHAPASAAALHGPADERALLAGQAETGRLWPPQLLAWLRMNDGEGRTGDAQVLPLGYLPLGVDWIVENWRTMVQVSTEVFGPVETAAADTQPAGSKTFAFPRSWLPIGDDTGGDLLFVDLRTGDRSGCIGAYEEGDAFTRPAIWEDIAAMLEDVAAALHTGRWVHPNDPDLDQVPVVENGKIRWAPGPSSQRKLAETKRRLEEQRRSGD
jgi:cell wall assembly regulator SMI1